MRPTEQGLRRGVTLATLAALSLAWTSGLAGVGSPLGSSGESGLPDGASVPTEALEDPASFTTPGQLGLGIRTRDAGRVVAASSTHGIPSAALAAYQRAETVINAADKACNIDWQLIAAIGRVESDHGRYGGNVLSTDGISRPGIYGIALDGTNQTQAISDTDAGQYDLDQVWDRAVGPMQFIPSTWSVVGVDADGDGQRNPQDVDDSALASAVYLCSGTDDLGTVPGRRAAVFRYNHSQEYVDLVLAVREAYLQGDYTAVPNYTASAITFTPDYSYTPPKPAGGKKPSRGNAGGHTSTGEGAGGAVTAPGDDKGGTVPDPGGGDGGVLPDADGDDGGLLGGGAGGGLKDVIDGTRDAVDKTTDLMPDPIEESIEHTLSLAEATLKCTATGYSALLTPAKWQSCLKELTT